jgi:protein-tyrosine phosphatase
MTLSPKMPAIPAVVACVLALGASTTRAQTIAESSVTRAADGRVVISWSATGPVDVYVGNAPDLDAKQMHLISDDDADGHHEYQVSDRARPYFLLRAERDGTTLRTAERVLLLDAGSNFRDVGGYATNDGRRVRWGRIYRTGAMPQLTQRDYEFLSQLGIRVFCDLRSVEERELAPTRFERVKGARYVAVDYPGSAIFGNLVGRDSAVAVNDDPRRDANAQRNLYRQWPLSLAPQYKEIFAALLAGEAPLAFNCSAGQDRTGVATALVLTALGVPRATILEDYHLSTVHRRPEYERGTGDYEALAATNIVARFYAESAQRGPAALKPQPLYDASGKARLAATFDEIERRWGRVERYLEEVLDVDANDVARLRARYLE